MLFIFVRLGLFFSSESLWHLIEFTLEHGNRYLYSWCMHDKLDWQQYGVLIDYHRIVWPVVGALPVSPPIIT